ncbi:MAG: 4Fe-4S dicluster domain-containing protein [bacterium]
MIFKTVVKKDFNKFLEMLIENNQFFAPRKIAKDKNDKPIYDLRTVNDFKEIDFDYDIMKYPPSHFFLPCREVISNFKIENSAWEQSINYGTKVPRILLGLHPCDINSLNKLDKVLMLGDYPSPYYAIRRKNTFIIGMDCDPKPFCFCRSVGAHTVQHGCDLFLTDIGDSYFVEIFSNVAFNFLKKVETKDITKANDDEYKRIRKLKAEKFSAKIDVTDLTKILDMEFQSDVWKEWGNKCLGCGSCARVCPTCYCYGIEEKVDLKFQHAEKLKILHACTLIDFAEVAGGFNFRPERHIRLKYRYYHKHRGFVEAYEESLCVGCGRCGQECLAGITVPEVISSIRE